MTQEPAILQCRVCGRLKAARISPRSEIQHRCSFCKAAPILHRIDEKAYHEASREAMRLNGIVRDLYQKYNEAAVAGRLVRARDLHARYTLVLNYLDQQLKDMEGVLRRRRVYAVPPAIAMRAGMFQI